MTTEIWMKLVMTNKGVKAKLTSPIFQQWTKAIIKAQMTAVELRLTTAMMPVMTLWIW